MFSWLGKQTVREWIPRFRTCLFRKGGGKMKKNNPPRLPAIIVGQRRLVRDVQTLFRHFYFPFTIFTDRANTDRFEVPIGSRELGRTRTFEESNRKRIGEIVPRLLSRCNVTWNRLVFFLLIVALKFSSIVKGGERVAKGLFRGYLDPKIRSSSLFILV